MINVECKGCPLRNFCPIYNQTEQDKEVTYFDCPLMQIVYKTIDKGELK